jgi:hypothetical protein
MHRFRRAPLALLLVLALLFPAVAQALTISSLTAKSTTRLITYTLKFCDRAGRIHEHLTFWALSSVRTFS